MSCKYPKTSRSYKFCIGCSSKNFCAESNLFDDKKEDIKMKTFLVQRTDRYSYCEDYAAVIISTDELHAEKYARMNISDFKKAKLEVTEINMEDENVILVANTGA